MNASQTDSDQHALLTHVVADDAAYRVSIDAGRYRIAYAYIRRTSSSIELSIDVATGNPSPRLRSRLIEAVFELDVMHTPTTCWRPCRSVMSICSTV